jgi:ribosomal protection tetracycline resistance protein
MHLTKHLNLGILAHVDAGKTSLTERLLFDAGLLDTLGNVDAGTTRTDGMELERRRGITIRSAVTSFAIGDVGVNLIDTPGHPDFIAEVERALAVLDGAVLVLSAVEGVQSQSVLIWRALRRLAVPTIIFINKIDRGGADPDRVAAEVGRRLQPPVPIVRGSALTGAGVPELTRVIVGQLPRAAVDSSAAPAGVVFKIDRGDRGRQVFVRMRAGTLALRDRVALGDREPERITRLRVSERGGLVDSATAVGGQIAVLGGLPSARIGDTFGPKRGAEYRFAPALLQTVVEPRRPEQRGALFAALRELAEQDPLIALRSAEGSDDIVLSLYGEVQKEVIASLLADGYGVDVTFRGTTVVCIERVSGRGAAEEHMRLSGNPYLATIGLRVEPARVGDGVRFELEVERGSMPPAFFAATEEGVRAMLRQGPCGWAVTDCLITMTHASYCPRQSHAHQKFNKAFSSVGADFRNLAPVVLMAALRRAGTQVCEPINRFDLEVAADAANPVLALLARSGGVALSTEQSSEYARIIGTVPTARIPEVTARLPGLAHGQSVFTSEFDSYQAVHSEPPVRTRTGPNPANREVWFRDCPR